MTSGRVPSLVSYCQRVLSAHADAIACLGDDVRYDVIKPVLECCSADTLLRLEQSSPYLEQDTSDLWERLCFKFYPLLTEPLTRNVDPPESWRDQYFLLREAEANRLEEVASRLRNQRMEAEERKREREVKLTDRLPPAKRPRTWGTLNQPKSLFQKTKSEASKLRRSLYPTRFPPQIPHGKVLRPITPSAHVAPLTKSVNCRMAVETVSVSRSSDSTPQATPPRSIQTTNPVSRDLSPSPFPLSAHPLSHSSQPIEPRLSKLPIQKKDRMSSLFMPKHRASSQLPSQAGNKNRNVPTG